MKNRVEENNDIDVNDDNNDDNNGDDKVHLYLFYCLHFHYYMVKHIRIQWIPFFESLDIANSRRAVQD